MKYVPDSMQRVGYINVIKVKDVGQTIESSIVSFVAEDPEEFEFISGADIWIKSYMPAGTTDNAGAVAKWSWGTWAKCAWKGAVSTCAGGAIGCTVAGPAYGQCVGSVFAAGAATAMISCALDQLL